MVHVKKKSTTFFQHKNCVCASGQKKEKGKRKKSRWTKKKKAYDMDKTPTHLHRHFCPTRSFNFFFSSFLPFQGKSFLVGSVGKYQGSTISFPSPPPNQIPFKMFSLLFYIYIYIFILPKIHSTKHIQSVYLSRIDLNLNFCSLHSTCIYIYKVNIPPRVRND